MREEAEEWGELQAAEPALLEKQFNFTAYHTSFTFDFTRFERVSTFDRCEMARLHLRAVQVDAPVIRLLLQQPRLQMTVHRPHLVLTASPWTTRGTVRFLIRQLQRYQLLAEGEMRLLHSRWRFRGNASALPDLRRFPEVFVPDGSGKWMLTTWVRLGLPFHPIASGTWGWTREGYVQEAARFWLQRGHAPTAEQEWDPAVRALVADALTTLPVPDYFIPCKSGPFRQVTFRGSQDYRLNPDAMPEGLYFTLSTAGVTVTYSVNGRAFLADTAQGVNVVTPFLTLRIKEALSLPLGDERVVWLSTGQAFRQMFERCKMTVREDYRGF